MSLRLGVRLQGTSTPSISMVPHSHGNICGGTRTINTSGASRGTTSTRGVGDCDGAEDPRLDARQVDPQWAVDRDDFMEVHVRARPQRDTKRFSLWRVAGRKRVTHLGSDLVLTARRGKQRLQRRSTLRSPRTHRSIVLSR
jgi:hypothetical protein